MLHTFIRLSLLWVNWFSAGTQSNLSGDSAPSPRRQPRNRPIVSPRIWTAMTPLRDITNYNNYYEFSTDKYEPAQLAKEFKTRPWTVKGVAVVHNPKLS